MSIRMEDFEAALPQAVVATRLVALALCGAVAAFGAVVVVIFVMAEPGKSYLGGGSLLALLSAVNAVFALAAYAISGVLYGSMLSPARLEAATGGEELARLIQTAEILRLAVLEGAASLGLAACLIGALGGGLRQQPLYWLNAVPAALFVWFVLTHLPEPERFREVFRAKVQGGAGG